MFGVRRGRSFFRQLFRLLLAFWCCDGIVLYMVLLVVVFVYYSVGVNGGDVLGCVVVQ